MGFGGFAFNLVCLLIRFLIMVAYLCVGAAVFRTLEAEGKNSEWQSKPEITQYFDWFHFVFSCTTTLGYGDIVPTRNSSKLFFIFYTMVGIPVMVWYLALCGQIQTTIYTCLLQKVRTGLWKRNDRSYKDIGPVLISFVMILIFWFVGAIVVHKTTQLSLMDSIYYWFVTLTTNGFGDIVLSGIYKTPVAYSWILYKWFLLNLVAAFVHSVLVLIHGFSEPKQSMCCMCWHREERDSSDEPDALARYNIQLAKKQEFIQLHRQTHL